MNDTTHDDVHGRQNGLGLEHRLRDLADHVEAAPSAGTRQVIGRRTRVLRRRRHVRRAAVGGALVVAAIVGAVALRHDPADVQIDPAGGGQGTGALPVIALDLDEWAVTETGEHDDVTDIIAEAEVVEAADAVEDAEAAGAVEGHAVQVFRPEGRLDGPVLSLEHSSASDAVVPTTGDEEVDLGGTPGFLTEAEGTVNLRWGVPYSDSHATLTAHGLDKAEVVAFAQGLEPLDDDLDHPPRAGARFGFTATELPEGIVEIALAPDTGAPVNVHQVWFERRVRGQLQIVEIQVDNRGERTFELGLYGADALLAWDTVEQVTVLDRPGLLRLDPSDGTWVLEWRHADGAWVTATIFDATVSRGSTLASVDRATVDQIIDDLRELPADEWEDLVASQPASEPGTVPGTQPAPG